MYNKHGGYFGEKEIVDYSININPLGVSAALKEKLGKTLGDIDRYPQIDGYCSKEKLSSYLNIDIERLIIGNGATELIYLFSRAMNINRALIVEPTFTEYQKSVEIAGGEIHHLLLDKPEFNLNMENLFKTVDREKIEAVYLCSPNNPTGTTISRADILGMLKEFKERNMYLFLDESFIEFSDCDSCIDFAEEHNIFVLRSITKIYGVPGIRIGYGVGKKDIVEKMARIKEPWSVNCMALKTLESYIEDEAYREATEKWYSHEKTFFLDNLSSVEHIEVFYSEANFVLCRLRCGDAKDLQDYMLSRGFYIRTCEDFYGLDKSYFRLAIRKNDENRRFLEGLNSYSGVK